MFEVIECEWVALSEQLDAATDLEGVLSSHHRYAPAVDLEPSLAFHDLLWPPWPSLTCSDLL